MEGGESHLSRERAGRVATGDTTAAGPRPNGRPQKDKRFSGVLHAGWACGSQDTEHCRTRALALWPATARARLPTRTYPHTE
jgi:hypothetical protein